MRVLTATAEDRLPWWEVARAYPCPVCTAGPGDRCVTQTGNQKFEVHADRTRLASAHGWKMPA